VKQHDLEGSLETLRKIQVLAAAGSNATENALKSKDKRSRQVKRLEIRLRKLAEALEELKIAVPFESRVFFEETIVVLERFRNQLLNHLFGAAGDFGDSTNGPLGLLEKLDSTATPGMKLSPASAPQRRYSTTISGDQFTELEFEEIRDAQKIVDRVKVFLELAESRLIEIERRRSGAEWEEEEPNPLEFYTVAQMVHAYQRSIEAIMINIDERVKYGTSKEKDIRKSLKLLNAKILDFLPRLEPIQQSAIDTKDEELYLEYKKAKKSSDTARKGSQMGLGAPVEK